MPRFLAFLLTSLVCVVAADRAAPADEPAKDSLPYLWVYAPINFQVDDAVDRFIELMRRAKKAGYNGFVVTDYKFGKLTDRPKNYYENMKRAKKAADEIGVEIVPMVGSFGWSNSMLQNDPNLAEGIPVKDVVFTVKDGKATLADTKNRFPFGGFEEWKKDRPVGWDFIDGPGQSSFADEEVKHGGKYSLRFENFKKGSETGNGRVSKKIGVNPWHQYHVKLWVKTKDLVPASEVHVTVLGKGRPLNFTNVQAKKTQDWTEHHVVFNTLENDEVSVLIGVWGGKDGALWLDDISLEPTAGINLVRRDGCPIRVTSADGKTEYTEGKDFEKWTDPKLGRVPYAGEFENYHAEPPIVLTADSRIKDGDQLKVSYYHTVRIYDGAVPCSLVHEDVFKFFESEVRAINDYFKPKKFFMCHDEIRNGGWDELSKKDGLTVGGLLAKNAERCVKIIRTVSPQAEIIDWNDMFDPHHNAHDKYYLMASTLEKSWEGLDKSVVVMNWNGGKAAESLRFFAERGHPQIIAGYYDDRDVKGNVEKWIKAAHGLKGIQGFMYTTWENNYKELEKFAEEVKKQTVK